MLLGVKTQGKKMAWWQGGGGHVNQVVLAIIALMMEAVSTSETSANF
jgi:hypothetical protein